MEARVLPREAAAVGAGLIAPRLLRAAGDERLVALVRQGHDAAFEAIYDRYHRPILSFCRHMLRDPEEAADALQHTFAAAYTSMKGSDKPLLLRAWLFAIARNRCYSVLRAHHEQPLAEVAEPATEGLAAQVQRREDLRELLGDMRELPDEQRAALVLAELGSLSHNEIGTALGVPPAKVKALVFQARESLLASRSARDTDCQDIRRELASARGAALRRANLRRHLRQCQGCREYRSSVQRQRRQLAAILPVIPAAGLKESVLGGVFGGGSSGGGAAAGGLFLSAAFKGLALKGLIAGCALLAGTAGTVALVHVFAPHGPSSALADTGQPQSDASQAGALRAGAQPILPWRSHHSPRAATARAVSHARHVRQSAPAAPGLVLAARVTRSHAAGASHRHTSPAPAAAAAPQTSSPAPSAPARHHASSGGGGSAGSSKAVGHGHGNGNTNGNGHTPGQNPGLHLGWGQGAGGGQTHPHGGNPHG